MDYTTKHSVHPVSTKNSPKSQLLVLHSNYAHCHNGGPCFHQQHQEEKMLKDEFSLYPNAYYPPGSLGVDDLLIGHPAQNATTEVVTLKTNQGQQGHVRFNLKEPLEDEYGFLPNPLQSPIELRTKGIDDNEKENQLSNAKKEQLLSILTNSENSSFGNKKASVAASCSVGNLTKLTPSLCTGTGRGYTIRGKHSSKLRRRRAKACYQEINDGRSRSLTHIDNLDPAMLLRNEDMDSRSEPDTSHDHLTVDVRPETETRETRDRRRKLARSQVSSSEFFGVCFEESDSTSGGGSCGLEEFLPVTRGVCLGDALRPIFEKRNINISQVSIFVDSSKTPLPSPANTDTYFVAGKNLTVKVVKEPDHKFHSRSFKQPSRKSSRKGKHKFFSASTEDTGNYSESPPNLGSFPISLEPGSASNSYSVQNLLQGSPTHQPHGHSQHQSLTGSISHEGSLKVKSTKQANRWSGLFSNSKDNSKMDLLVEQLNEYSQNGTPKPTFLPIADEIESQYSIENDWKCFVLGWKDLSDRNIQQQTAIWELVETEVIYLKTIKVITDLFLACLYNLQSSNILNEIDRDQLFSNIPEIYKSNQVLWLECILPMVEKARNTNQLLEPSELGAGFLRFGNICQPYTKYCLDQTKCQRYCREKYQENEYFKTYLVWCETRKECNRLRLMDILVRPMQRMTKYSLLLKAILKHTEDLEQRKCVEEMISNVEKFVRSVNGALRSRQDAERLQGISERIEMYDVVETREDELESLVKAYSKLDLFHPMPGCCTSKRWLIFDVDVKIKDSFTSKMDAHCFLFTDMLLICKPVGRSKGEKMKVIRQPFIVDRLVTKELSKDPCSFGLVYLNEYGTASAALSLHFNEPKLVKATMDHIKKAQKIYNEIKEKEHLEYAGDEENGGILYLNHLGGSSRASQLSSLVHSHSGSVEINEASVLSSQAPSFENELRGSSLSSDDGNANEASGLNLNKSRSLSTETGAGRPISPRRERRLFLSKSPSPNTLTIQIPIPNLSGQSLPNLTSASESSPPTYAHNLSLTVPKSLLSPTHRGVSYPPPSPKSLTRSYALLQSRNPPLQKSKNIIGPTAMNPEKTVSLDVQVPEIRGLTSDKEVHPDYMSGLQMHTKHCNPSNCYAKQHNTSKELRRPKEFIPTAFDEHQHVDPFPQYDSQGDANFANAKRLARNERVDSKRYHTAGAIEDIKKENSKERDSAIHKRLSWNSGQQKRSEPQSLQSSYDLSMPSQFYCNESMTSIRSSSGVSSTSSLLHCISDMESSNSVSTGSTTINTPCMVNSTQNLKQQFHSHPSPSIPTTSRNEPSPSTSMITQQLPDVRIVCEPAGESDETSTIYSSNSNNNDFHNLHEISNHIETHFVEGQQCKNCNSGQHKENQQAQSISTSPDKSNFLRDFVLANSTMQSSDV